MRKRFSAAPVIATLALLAPAARGAEVSQGARDQGAATGAVAPERKDPVAVASAGPASAAAPLLEGAAASTPAVTKADVEGVRDEVQVLRDQWQRSLDKNVAQAVRSLNLGASAQTRFVQTEERAVPNTFGINAILLNFKGNLKRDYEEGKNLDYALGFSAGGDFTAKPNDVYLTYAFFGTLDKEQSRLGVSAGQQKKPFSLEASTTEEYKPTIRGAQFASKLGLDERDIGLVLTGDLFPHVDFAFNYRVPLVAYSLGLVSGAGPNKGDDNNTKDVVARVVLNAPVDWSNLFRGLSLGGSYYRGKRTATANDTTNTRVTVNDPSGAPVVLTTKSTTAKVTQLGPKNRWGVDLAYVNTPVGFTVEYARGEDEVKLTDGVVNNTTRVSAPTFGVVESEGFAATIFYNFGDQFVKAIKGQDRYDDWYPVTYQPFVRFDRWIADRSASSTYSDVYTLGFNWFFAQTTKLQVNYNVKRESKDPAHNDELLAQFQFGF